MEPINVSDVRARLDEREADSLEFLRRDSLSVELYVLDAGATDGQTPHTEDEIYYVLSGWASIRIEEERYPVEPGDVVFVERGVDHAFVDIEAELSVLVVFAPPFGSLTAEDRSR